MSGILETYKRFREINMSIMVESYRRLETSNPDLWNDIFPTISEVSVNMWPEQVKFKHENEDNYDDVARYVKVNVERRSWQEDSFAVKDMFTSYDKNGLDEHESLPSSRTDDYLENFRHTFFEALAIAEEVSKNLCIKYEARFHKQGLLKD
jgi:hypothetical protein